jgi:hypothetical protein
VLRDYAGNPFDKRILPRVQEATKEVTAQKTAADTVKTRESPVRVLDRNRVIGRCQERSQKSPCPNRFTWCA